MAASATRTYTVSMIRVSVSSAITIIQIVAGATVPLELLRAEIGQSSSTTSTMQTVQINRKSIAASVSSYTPKLNGPVTDPAASAVGGASATGTNASAEGTDTFIIRQSVFNYLNGWIWLPSPPERIFVDATGIIGLKFPTSAGTATITADLVFSELA